MKKQRNTNVRSALVAYLEIIRQIKAERAAPTIIPAEEDKKIQSEFLQNWHEDGEIWAK